MAFISKQYETSILGLALAWGLGGALYIFAKEAVVPGLICWVLALLTLILGVLTQIVGILKQREPCRSASKRANDEALR